MNRRSMLAATSIVAATVGAVGALQAATEDVGEGCEGAVRALKGWIDAISRRDFDYLERHLAEEFAFTSVPMRVPSGAVIRINKNKREFIEQDRHVYNSRIELLRLTALRLGDLVITVVLARISEEFRGDLGPQLPSAAEMSAFAKDRTLGYASGWREIDGRWQCTSHHVLGDVTRTE